MATTDAMRVPTEVCHQGMVWVPGGDFKMGDERFYAEERPVRRVTVTGFWIDRSPVTVADFARFVEATGYVTIAERRRDECRTPNGRPSAALGSFVFEKADGRVDLADARNWWRSSPDACWWRPCGHDDDLGDRDRHPVVHVAHDDALAYARWVQKDLPSEAEWEFAARGGLHGAAFAWGHRLAPRGSMLANFWQGEFPWRNLCTDGFEGTSPVGSFPANGYGLHDMAGNVWEWTSDASDLASDVDRPFAAARDPAVLRRTRTLNGELPSDSLRYTIKGGSHLCATNYSLRFRPAARQARARDASSGDLGFRCAARRHDGVCEYQDSHSARPDQNGTD